MKNIYKSCLAIAATFVIATSCQRSAHQEVISANNQTPQEENTAGRPVYTPGTCNEYAYIVTLESITPVGNVWEWVWSVQNPNPGNGTNGTSQDLSHWGMQFGGCFNFSSVTGGAVSSDGTNWNSFTPSFQVDPSQPCMTTPVMKFNYGTSGGAKRYYKLIVNQNYSPVDVPGYYKSGNNTGCCIFMFSGIGCVAPTNPDDGVVK